MNTERNKNYLGKTVVVDNNILTDFIELTAALEFDYFNLFNQLFAEVKIPTPILEDENIHENLGSLNYIEGTLNKELGYSIFIELGETNDNMAKKLSEYDRYVIAIAGENDLLAVSNDKPVRKICRKYDIKITGSLGIFISAFENDFINFKQLKLALEFLFSEDSSCYLANNLKDKIYKHYHIK